MSGSAGRKRAKGFRTVKGHVSIKKNHNYIFVKRCSGGPYRARVRWNDDSDSAFRGKRGGLSSDSGIPTAYAAGCILVPLRGGEKIDVGRC